MGAHDLLHFEFPTPSQSWCRWMRRSHLRLLTDGSVDPGLCLATVQARVQADTVRTEEGLSMKCPHCNTRSRVLDSASTDEYVRRRRECSTCKRRWTTYETANRLDSQPSTGQVFSVPQRGCANQQISARFS